MSGTDAAAAHWRIQDEPALLDCMLADADTQPELYQPGRYWRGKARSAANEIREHGLARFRGRGNGIGLSYADKQDLDVRESMNFGARRVLKWFLDHAWPMNKVIDGQVRLNLRVADEAIQEKGGWLAGSPRIAELLSRYRVPYSLGGDTALWAEVGGQRIAHFYLQVLDSVDLLQGAGVGFGRARSMFEIGGGFGAMAHVVLHNFANIRKYVYLDIPPNLYVGTQYLKSHFGAAVKDYRALRSAGPLRFAEDDALEVLCIAPWQVEQLQSPIDLFHNAHSFVEMPEAVVANYARHAERLLAPGGDIALISYDNYDTATTIHPDRLPGFFGGEFSSFRAPMATSPGAVNHHHLCLGARA